MKQFYVVALLALANCAGASATDARWSNMQTPAAGPAEVFGTYTAGCIAGAKALPLEGNGYQVMRSSRNRFYGHPRLIHFVTGLGRFAAAQGSMVLVGDMSQARGGPMNSGHASHQIGLDVDIWYMHPSHALGEQEREEILPVSLLASGTLDEAAWQPYYQHILQRAAETPEVERIFVNPAIKQKLCETAHGQAWLHKIRPWWKHDDHFHVRLHCPAGTTQCKEQEALPAGDGCDASLAWWFSPEASAPAKKPAASAPPALPAACEALLK